MPTEAPGESAGQEPPPGPGEHRPLRNRLTRRALLGGVGIGVGVGVATAGGALVAGASRDAVRPRGGDCVAFHGPHQAGFLNARQTYCHLVAFDFGARTDRGRAAALLLRWSTAAERMTRGAEVGEDIAPPGSRASDTGVALGAGPASLTPTAT